MAKIFTTTYVINVLLGVLFFTLTVYLIDVYNAYQKEKELYGLKNSVHRKDIIRNNKALKRLNKTIKRYLSERNKEQYAPLLFYGTLGIAVFLFCYFISMKQLLFAILAPITFVWFVNKVLTLKLIDVNEKVDEQLPFVIDNIVKVFSKYGDLKSVIYETSLLIEDPLKYRFERLARTLISEANQEKALLDFADELDNIWVYSLVFILLSYKDETKKEDVILNLRHLAQIISKENDLKRASVTDKKYGVVLNYTIAGIAVAGSIANILFNPVGKSFFFESLTGIVSIIAGYASVIATILINIKLSSKKGRGK